MSKHFWAPLVLCLVPSLALAQQIGFNFSSDREDASLAPGDIAGVVQQGNWNNWDGILSNVTEDTVQSAAEIASPNAGVVTDSDGNTHPGISVNWESRNAWNTNNGVTNGDNKLMNGYLDNNAGTPQINVNVAGLPDSLANDGYDVYAYFGSDGNGRTGTISNGPLTYSYSTFSNQGGDFPNLYTLTTDTAAGNPDANYAVFSGMSGDEFTITLDRGSNNSGIHGIQIIASGQVFIPPVAGRGIIGESTVSSMVVEGSLEFGESETGPGLAQEWYAVANPGDKAGVDAAFANNFPVVPAFRAAGGSWWTGDGTLPGVQTYPVEVQPPLNDNYTVRSTGEILIESSGPFTFTDGVDDYTYLAIDTDRSGTAGDTADEVLINDNAWTTVLRDGNNGGEGYAEITIDNVPVGGEWLKLEFNMGEGGGGDSGTVYWDFDATAPEGQRHGGLLLPFVDQAFFSEEEAAAALIPDSHLRSTTAPLIGGEVAGSIPASPSGWEFEVNTNDGTSDAFVLTNPNPDLFSTTFDVDGAQFFIIPEGEVSDGDSFQIVIADTITGTPTIATEGWSWDGSTGSIFFGGGGPMIPGDADGDGDVDTADRTIQTTNWTGALPPGDPGATKTKAEGDADGDGDVDTADANLAITNWTGAQQGPAGNLEDGDDADLVYNPASGNVTLDASDTASGVFISFVMATGQNNMMPDNLTKSADGSAGPFFDVGTNTDATTFQIGQTDPLNQGAGPEIDLGDIFPAGMDLAGLSEYLTLADYASALGEGGTLDLIVVPEPSSIALMLLGVMSLIARRRRK